MELAVKIGDLDDDGRGVGAAGGLELHVTGALPGETVRAHVLHQSPHAPRAWAEMVAIVGEPSQERVMPACPGHGRCGGCMLQHLAYPAQLTAKRRRVERALGRAVEDVVPSPHELHYRNKAKYVLAARTGGGLLLGSYQPASHAVVEMAGCQVPEEPIDAVARRTVALLEAEDLPAYDEARRAGELRYLVVRRSADDRLLVVLVTATARPRPALLRAARALRSAMPAVAGVVHNVNATRGGAIFGAEERALAGAARLADEVGGVQLELSARAFFQVNRAVAARLYAAAGDEAGARRELRVVDLYCGVGGIALSLARRGARVVGIEAHEAAVADARRSAAALRLAARARFLAADAAEGLAAAARLLGGIDALIVDPPRKGLGAAARAAIIAAAPPRLVYVSCNPGSLATDLAALTAGGYTLRRVRPFDLMPGTAHVEVLCALDRG